MKLSEKTIEALKNFAAINSGVVLRSGNVQSTISTEQTIWVEVTLEDTFNIDFGIYDLNQFLGTITTLDNPELTFTEDEVTMNDGMFEMVYRSCATNLIKTPPRDKTLVMKDPDISFNVSSNLLQRLIKLSLMNDLTDLCILGNNEGLFLRTYQDKNDTSNFALTRIGDYSGEEFSILIKVENLKMTIDDYTVQIKKDRFSLWTNKNETLKYFIAVVRQ